MRPDLSPPPLVPARVHEATGPGAVAFALMQAASQTGPIAWIMPAHEGETLLPAGLARILSPARLMLIRGPSETDLLWSVEEVLRSGAVGMVIAAPAKPLSLTAGRRLQLAAEAGRTLGLLLVREGAGSNAVETRWHCAPLWDERPSTLQEWSLIRNKKGTSGTWAVHWHDPSRSIRVVSKAGERALVADPAH
jgi:protein ImuA